ncbi:MAG: PaaI family thioesterase [Candidatus Tectomicrobia bacterium]|uniref:PaaI family thioesterase n=1 Tax=Tectimicrobiota bacterium TaxID=2528274 RepID=A0A932GNF7_UNCTE|nr:PaaI family thioesterase [Candidatus Tectomicrobia bacterium]
MELSDDGMCFACGKKNPLGLHLKVRLEGERDAVAEFTPAKNHQGYKDIVHGGILVTVLDEVIAHTLYQRGILAMTGKLEVRYHRPALVGETLQVRATIEKESSRGFDVRAQAVNRAGEKVAEARATMIRQRHTGPSSTGSAGLFPAKP